MPKFSFRPYYLPTGRVLFKQTVLRDGKYVLVEQPTGGHQERHLDPNDAQAVQQAVVDAEHGKL
jgi:hypothetical protein